MKNALMPVHANAVTTPAATVMRVRSDDRLQLST
jgi:hypothetical protein